MESEAERPAKPAPAATPVADAARPKPLAREVIAACYRVLLGREAENADVLNLRTWLPNYDILLHDFIISEEFSRRVSKSFGARMLTEAERVDVDVSEEQLYRMFERIRVEWSKLGEVDPYWSVLTYDDFHMAIIDDEAMTLFYNSGAEATQAIDAMSQRCGVDIPASGTCLEFGCGVGRVTMHLASRFRRVIAVDISQGNLNICREFLDKNNITNVETVLIGSPEEVAELPHYDFLSSTIVFQHNPPPVQQYLLDTLLKKISSGGACLFQIATHTPDYKFNAARYLKSMASGMEMHCLPMSTVFRLLAKHRLMPLEVLMDSWTGLYGSHTFFAVKGR